jgi:hypothetical protein
MRLSRQLWVLSFTLAACASPAHWDKPGAGPIAVDEDMQQCRMQARLSPEAHREPLGPRSGLGGAGTSAAIDRMEDRDAREAQLIQKCMMDKGYSAKR